MAQLKLALMDMNNGVANQGMRGLRNIVKEFQIYENTGPESFGERPYPRPDSHRNQPGLIVDEFEVRKEHQVPGLEYNIYLSSGGPGDPRASTGRGEKQWFRLIDKIWRHNQTDQDKKYVFFVCHSFQMACHHFGLCDITRRKSTSFGIYPIHKTELGKKDPLLNDLKDPFFAVDSRDWQLVQPNKTVFKKYGAKMISLEKIRTHVEYERAIMAIRFSSEMVGTQFHPEADPEGMKIHFANKLNRDKVIKNFSEKKYQKMMTYLDNPEAIIHTYETVIPGFLRRAIHSLTTVPFKEHAA